MQIGTSVQVIHNAVTPNRSFLHLQKGTVIDSEVGPRAGISGTWNQVKMDSDKFAVPYWCLDQELRTT